MTTADPLPPGQFPLPPILHHAQMPPSLITQGAEARLYKTTHLLPSRPAALKYRPPKPWRHPTLDARLTRARILAEARILHKCHREGVPVPPVLALDEAAGWLMLEWVPGVPVRVAINRWLQQHHPARKLTDIAEESSTQETLDADMRTSVQGDKALADIMRRVGAAIGSLHNVGIVHGDLTTSNMMLRPAASGAESTADEANVSLDGDVVLIDFGLASVSNSDEDRAVDLYVLERAFGSTHPRAEVLFEELLAGYKQSLPAKQSTVVLRKLEDVRMRGRKRSMVG
ncbi:serine/threonine-protein kinase BUD32 [Plectosphaerella plurivora]|uniref:EKC/KEOPS complex subunit BUD32 n=1 Tax=Plectosphaerella plurivora TaxID=936078 RepID=A0A9P9AE12_9PEZI|nr:serine/threonine-protein kinase BUD32 [Plectosphaerella plurivora]